MFYNNSLGRWAHFGGLSPVKQSHFTADESAMTFSSPPRRRGIYAFQARLVDLFMIGSTYEVGHVSNKSFRLRDDNGTVLDFDDHLCERLGPKGWRISWVSPQLRALLKKKKIKQSQLQRDDYGLITVLRKPRVFSYTGLLWHHLLEAVDPEAVLEQRGKWVLSSFRSWRDAFIRQRHVDLQELHTTLGADLGSDVLTQLSKDPWKGSGMKMCTDHLEVFIERPK